MPRKGLRPQFDYDPCTESPQSGLVQLDADYVRSIGLDGDWGGGRRERSPHRADRGAGLRDARR